MLSHPLLEKAARRVAAVAGRHEVVGLVPCLVAVKMIDAQAALAGPLPLDLATTPVTGVSARSDQIEEDMTMLIDDARI